jgi:hypothetical protein
MLTGHPLKEIEKLAAKDAAEDLDGEEEGILGMNPAGIGWVETAGRNDAVEMRMQSQVLSPSVENAEEADLGSEVLGVGRYFEHGLSAGAEEQIVEQPWMALTERVQLVGQGKDDVEVGTLSRSCSRRASHRWRAWAWHLGQWRLRQEL